MSNPSSARMAGYRLTQRIRATGLALATALLTGSWCMASPDQTPPPPLEPPPSATPPAAPDPASEAAAQAELDRLLSMQPVELESLGVSLRVPKHAVITRLPDTGSYRIDDGNDPPRFIIRAQPMAASASESSPAEQFEQHQKFLLEKGQEFSILRDIDLVFGRSRAKLAYVALPAGDGITAVTGWLIIQTGPHTFIVFSIISSGVDFTDAEDLLAASFSTISLRAIETAAASQTTKLERTERFLASLTPQKLKLMADDQPRWYRLYRPGGGRNGSDLEIGFLRIRAFEGERGEISTSSNAGSLSQPESGLIVEVVVKLLVGGDAAHIVDVQSRYWQSWDRQAESWSMVSTERIGQRSTTWGQTGWRSRPMSTGEQGSILTVVNSQPSMAMTNEEYIRARQPVEWEVPAVGYINQAEMILLGSLLPRDGSLDGEFTFYCYDTRTNKLPQRIDRWMRDPDGSGQYTLVSRPSAEGAEMKQLFSSTGERLRRIDADGLVTEVIEHADLLRMWRTKGLPTG